MSREKDKYFMEYAKQDVLLLWEVAQSILELHSKFDISICVSLPQLGSKIFKHHFMEHTIPLPHKGIIYASLYSYHGGKNLCNVEKGMYKNVYSYDIVSAYPFAMHSFPSFSYLDKYYKVTYIHTFKTINPYGIYKISGEAKNCKYPILYSHDYLPLKGFFEKVWVSGFELKEALRNREVKLSSMFGYAYDYKSDKRSSPFEKYVDHFFKEKNNSEGVIKHQNKLLLNSLYGKFIQTIKHKGEIFYDVDQDKIINNSTVEGTGMFHPFIASLITGHTRAYIHKLEHLTNSMHTSTDSVKSFKKIPDKLLGDKLGQLKIECFGDCLIWRSRLYVHWNGKRENGDIKKYALHAFRGSKEQLIEMFDTNTHTYTYKKMNKLKESIKRGLQVNAFEDQEAQIKT